MSDAQIFIAWVNPPKEVAWNAYIGEAGVADVKIRKLNSGVIEVAIGDEDWREV